MKKTIWWLILFAGLGLVAAILYFAMQKKEPESQPQAPPRREAPAAPAPPPAPPAAPPIRYPIASKSQAKPLPALGESDAAVREALHGLWTDKILEQYFHLDDFIRRVVATVDSLPRQKIALRLMPLKPAAGKFLTTGKNETLAMSPANAARYAPYVRMAAAVDASKLVALYVRFYPLFQQAYQDLGYPKGYFNDRLVEVIDDLLAAPDAQPPVRLVQPKVFYEFADPQLEARSAGQKILMRIGRENESRIKSKLREIRNELTREGPRT